MTGADPIPYKKTKLTPNLGALDESDDIRGGMGIEGLSELSKFVKEGGTLITDGSSSAMLADYGISSGVTLEHPASLFARGTILRGMMNDTKSPILYGFDQKDIPVYFNQDPVLNVAAGGIGGFGGAGGVGSPQGQNVTPMAIPLHVSPLDPATASEATVAPVGGRRGGGGGGAGRGGNGRGGRSRTIPRVLVY